MVIIIITTIKLYTPEAWKLLNKQVSNYKRKEGGRKEGRNKGRKKGEGS